MESERYNQKERNRNLNKKVEGINKLISKSKEDVARYPAESVCEMKRRILVELEDLRYFISKIVKED